MVPLRPGVGGGVQVLDRGIGPDGAEDAAGDRVEERARELRVRPAGETLPDLESQKLAPGDRISGVVGFAIPQDAVVASIEYNPEYQRLVTLADMSGAGGAATRGAR